MRRIIPALLLILPVWAWAGNLALYVGQQKTVNVEGAEQISVAGKGQIATADLVGNKQIIVTGHAPGTVSMTILYRDGRKEEMIVRVLSREREQAMQEFDNLAPLFNDIKAVQIGNSIGLTGKVYSINEKDYLNAFLERYPEIINLMEDVRGQVLIQLDVQICEVNLNDAASLGIEWFSESSNNVKFPDGLDYGEVKTGQGSFKLGEEYVPRRLLPDPQFAVGPLARLSPFTMKLDFLVGKGAARTLARPKLVCKSGERADFLVGGEFPIRGATPEKVAIEWKRYGTRLGVEPVLVRMGSNEIEVKIQVEISDLDWANQVEGFPAVTQRMVSTNVKLIENNAVAIAGLLAHRKSRTQTRVPFLGAIPILGRLFSSTKDQDIQTETVILLTPHILPVKAGELNMKINDKEMRKQIEK